MIDGLGYMTAFGHRYRKLTPAQQEKVALYRATLQAELEKKELAFMDSLLAEQLEFEIVDKPGREVVDRSIKSGICYQLERVKCGKEMCKCTDGDLHGPYWYAYYRQNGKLKSKYVGKRFKDVVKK